MWLPPLMLDPSLLEAITFECVEKKRREWNR